MRRSLLLLLLGFSAVATAFSPSWRQRSIAKNLRQLPERRSEVRDTRGFNAIRRDSNRFANPKAAQFHVDGANIPLVDFDVGDSWAGLLPISSDPHETRKLYFWYFPPTVNGSENDFILWANGGPGCSSLEGFLQENGPISWQYGQANATRNPYSWTNLGHMLWVDQPVGTGFSEGVPDIHNETQLAAELVGFMQQFLNVFAELKGKKFYLTGESYAGKYLPNIADYMLSHPTLLDLKVQAMWLGSPALAADVVADQAPAVNFVHKNLNVFPFNQSFLAQLDQIADKCNYNSFLEKYLTYPPPPAPFSLPGKSAEADPGCDVYTQIIEAVLLLNPAFNEYRIFDMPPILWDVLGFPGTFPQIQSPVYFNRSDVKAAIHAPENVSWDECNFPVFVNGVDNSPIVSWEVLPRVMNRGVPVVIVTGLADFIIQSEGTRIAIQNMTWGGSQGFQKAPLPDSFILDGVGAAGTVQSERGLTFYELPLTGHMVPQFNPPAAFQSMQFMLGSRTSP
ncbi:Alpha/Beta hydrolase protein [Russula ochroleuca]|uniref:Carboxypeptidase n=1 Tax=Russula ochroleuca TaxID=152965 RepID=A0A9P5MSS5_9AGAM|nr:Alpha/Beta hydrolase protein [Russula ochroleuca]